MAAIGILLLEFVGMFTFILVMGYLLPAGQFYYKYYVRINPEREKHRIQLRRPTDEGIRREIKLSLQTITIFAVMATILLEMYKAGWTSIYLRFREYPLYYLPISFFLCLFIHDTYFYWTHRLMHWRPLFKYTHAGHHKSVSPTPWAIFAFQPAEAVIQFLGIMGLVIFLPLHPVILFAFLWYDSLVNTAGHTGYEMVPQKVSRNWLLKGFNTVTHHDTHHTNMRVNYGAFFNIWDRWMGTFHDDVAPAAQSAQAKPARKPAPQRASTAMDKFRVPARRKHSPGIS
jgi:lathosterol oxidase